MVDVLLVSPNHRGTNSKTGRDLHPHRFHGWEPNPTSGSSRLGTLGPCPPTPTTATRESGPGLCLLRVGWVCLVMVVGKHVTFLLIVD